MKEAEKAAAQEARAALVERLRHATVIELRGVTRRKYFRLVAEVIADGENMSDLLLDRGLTTGGNGIACSVRGWGECELAPFRAWWYGKKVKRTL